MLLIGMLVALAQAGSGVPDAAADRLHRGACLAVEVASPQDPRASPARLPSFSATRIVDLRISAILRHPAGRGTLRFRVYTPGGFLYQTLTVPFMVRGPRTGPLQARVVDGFPRPQPEQAAQAAPDGRHRVSATLPVGGTIITSNGLYGRWAVEPWIDGFARPCGPSQAFVIGE